MIAHSISQKVKKVPLLIVVSTLFICSALTAASPAQGVSGEVTGSAKALEEKPDVRTLADLVSRLSKLRERSAVQEINFSGYPDLAAAEKKILAITGRTKELASQLALLRKSEKYGFDQLADLKAALRSDTESLRKLSEEFTRALSLIDALQKEWSGEKENWKAWISALQQTVPHQSVDPASREAQTVIDKMLERVSQRLDPLLAVQQKAEAAATELRTASMELDGLLQGLRGAILRKSAPSMFSPKYYGQYHKEMWEEFTRSLRSVRWFDREFFVTQGWVVFLQIVSSLLLIVVFRRRRVLLAKSKRWGFLIQRPVSSAVFTSIVALFPLYGDIPPLWRLILWGLVSVSAVRLVETFIILPWKRLLLYMLAALFFAVHLFRVFGLPQPIFRLYVALVALGGSPLCLWRGAVNARRGGPSLYSWALHLGAAVFAFVFVAQIAGYNDLATHLLESTIKTTFLILLAWMLSFMVRGVVEFIFERTLIQRISLIRRNKDLLLRRSGSIVTFLVSIFALVILLQVWQVFDTPLEAVEKLLSFGFSVGEHKFTVGHLVLALLLLYGSFLISWATQSILTHDVFPKSHVEQGTGVSIVRLIHYGLILIGVLLALSALGFELKNLIILTGALGIGIGFGLQNIANNFVSGLILLFERPIKIGDIVQINGVWGEIKKLGLRATVVETFDRSEIIVPNSDLVSNQVTNYTLSDRMVRLTIPVGVAYGSNVPLVMEVLMGIAREHPLVVSQPEPQILFVQFGESSLDFEVRAWIADVRKIFVVKSGLHQSIDQRFRQEKIEIAFPQRDLHFRTVDDPMVDKMYRLPRRHLRSEESPQGDATERSSED